MATYKVHKTKDYTVMSNTHLRDKNLSFKAKGLLSVMLSLPEEWDYSMNGLVAISKENLTAVRNTLSELEENRYLIRERKQNSKGQFEYEYHIYEKPHTESTVAQKPYTENPHTDKPIQLSTNELSTNQSSTKQLNKDNKDIYNIVISYLNEKTGLKYKATSKATQQHIHARIEEGFTIEDFKTVIDKKCADWIGTEWEQYLRPSTLFGTKFESYLNAPVTNRKTYGQNGVEIKPNAVDDLAGIL